MTKRVAVQMEMTYIVRIPDWMEEDDTQVFNAATQEFKEQWPEVRPWVLDRLPIWASDNEEDCDIDLTEDENEEELPLDLSFREGFR